MTFQKVAMDIPTYKFDEPIERCNSDKHSVDTQGEKLLNLCKNSRLRIINGRMRGDRFGNFTRYPLSMRETPSTIDYMICDTDLYKNIKSFTPLHHLGLSDHECLSASILTGGFLPKMAPKIPFEKEAHLKYLSPSEFCLKLNGPLGRRKIDEFLTKFQNTTDYHIEQMTSDLLEIINSASYGNNEYRQHNINKKLRNKKDKTNHPPWFTTECKKSKWSLNKAEKDYKRNPFYVSFKEKLFIF